MEKESIIILFIFVPSKLNTNLKGYFDITGNLFDFIHRIPIHSIKEAMRKGNAEAKFGTIVFNLKSLNKLKLMGYKYVQVKGLTVDRHYDYIEPHFLMLIPFKELSTENTDNGIYEPIESDLLFQWAAEANEFTEILIAKRLN